MRKMGIKEVNEMAQCHTGNQSSRSGIRHLVIWIGNQEVMSDFVERNFLAAG